MEDFIYFCCMLRDSNLTYFNNIIASIAAPGSSFMSLSSYIGSSNSQSSISDFIENKTKSVGLTLIKSMSRIFLSQISNISNSSASLQLLTCILFKNGKTISCENRIYTKLLVG